MRSVKPGRGPSLMGGIVSIALCVFGAGWTVIVLNSGAPPIFPLFGVVFVCIGVMQAVYNFRNATGENRYSAFDITDRDEEPDPLDERFGRSRKSSSLDLSESKGNFCPYCGARAQADHAFCKQCGKAL